MASFPESQCDGPGNRIYVRERRLRGCRSQSGGERIWREARWGNLVDWKDSLHRSVGTGELNTVCSIQFVGGIRAEK